MTRQWSPYYYNWDSAEVKKAFAKDPYFFRGPEDWVVFDEIHKMRRWKTLMKGYYDSPTRRENFIVTGSGRFTQFQRGGDSLQGRYESFHLWPLLYDEILPNGNPTLAKPRDFSLWAPRVLLDVHDDEPLLRFGGFPQPYLSHSDQRLRRWEDLYVKRLVEEDVRDYSKVENLDKLDLMVRLLPQRITSPLSMKALAEDVEISPQTIKNWLRLLEVLYLGFQLKPWHRKIHRAVKKEAKWYFFPWTMVKDEGAKFENYLAVQLYSILSLWSEQGYGRYELYYLRDQDRREVDFIICRDLQPIALIEAKESFQPWPASLHFYARKLNIPSFLVYRSGPTVQQEGRLGWSMPSSVFLRGLLYNSKDAPPPQLR